MSQGRNKIRDKGSQPLVSNGNHKTNTQYCIPIRSKILILFPSKQIFFQIVTFLKQIVDALQRWKVTTENNNGSAQIDFIKEALNHKK